MFDFSDDDLDEMDNDEDKEDMLWVGAVFITAFFIGYWLSKPVVQSPVVIDHTVV
jgi:hypothetical protein